MAHRQIVHSDSHWQFASPALYLVPEPSNTVRRPNGWHMFLGSSKLFMQKTRSKLDLSFEIILSHTHTWSVTCGVALLIVILEPSSGFTVIILTNSSSHADQIPIVRVVCMWFAFFFRFICSEIDRDANIAKNRALFEDLGLKQAIHSLGTTTVKPAAQPVQPKRVKREREEDLPAPRRQSRRLQRKLNADETPEERLLREVGVSLLVCFACLRKDHRKRNQGWSKNEKKLRKRLASPSDLDMTSWISRRLLKRINRKICRSCRRRWGMWYSVKDVFGENSRKAERAVQEIKEKVQNLKVVARAKVVTERIYCAAYHPDVTKDLIFFGGS